MRFKDQVAIVTGAASGIGKAIAIKFAQEGPHVVICDRDEANFITSPVYTHRPV